MNYKEYYLFLKSPEDIMQKANSDMALICVVKPDKAEKQMELIRKSAEEAINEKFGKK